ncbi:MAG: exodeoxyribonuclease VII large subunit [Bacteroidales bacterium]|nr:exodeoxyribonuclease VII large subunit [Bacteroidales bacterium]
MVEKQQGKVVAQMRANIWSSHFVQINRKFISITGDPIKEGIKVLFLARLTYHEQYGIALNIVDVEPSFTLGEMAREKLENIEKLKKEGVFDSNRKLHFTLLPKRIAVISVETSKGYSDFVNVIKGNSWNYKFELSLFPALLQGDGAIESIVAQLETIQKIKDNFDVVTIIRGGGGDVGLSAYDHYQMARAVAVFPLPVIAGIGHSTNETIVQMVAYANKITPTEAGHFLIQQFHNFSVRTETAREKIIRLSKQILERNEQNFKQQVKAFDINTRLRLHKASHRLENLQSSFQFVPVSLIKNKEADLLTQIKLVKTYAKRHLTEQQNKVEMIEKQVVLLKPENVLRRGYSITYYNGKPVTDVGVLPQGVSLTTQLYNGELKVKVEEITKNSSES